MNFFKKKNKAKSVFATANISDSKSLAFYAEQMINNPIYSLVMDTLRQEYTSLWQNSLHDREDLREEYYRYFRALNQIDTRLKEMVISVESDSQMEEFQKNQALNDL